MEDAWDQLPVRPPWLERIIRLVTRDAPMLFQLRDRQLRLRFLSGTLLSDLGIDPDRAIGTRFDVLPGTHDPNHPLVRAYESALLSNSPHPVHFEDRGRTIEALVEPLYDSASRVAATVSVWFDVTERRRSEQQLQRHFGQFELAARHTPSVFWATDEQGVITALTGRAVAALGWDPSSMIGKPLEEALQAAGSTDPARPGRLLAPLSSGEPISYESTWGDRAFSIHIKPLREPHGGMSGSAGIAYDITDRKRDALTGLPNRELLKELVAHSLARSAAHNVHAGIIAVDLDHFQRINDTLGLDAGDSVLSAVARRLQRAIPSRAMVGSSSGDKFIIAAAEMPDAQAIAHVAHSALEAFEMPFEVQGRELFVRASAGVSIFPEHGETGELLLARADAALLHAKQQGRNSVQIFHAGIQAAAMDRLQLEIDLRQAIERDQLCLHYQPIVDIMQHRVIGAEALVRWEHPTRGLLGPDSFIALAEENGLIIALGEWVLADACRTAAPWTASGALEFVSVNVSARQLESDDLARSVMRTLRRVHFNPEHMELEFTESAVMRDRQRGAELLRVLRAAGVRIGIDDFGTGYSSLAYLKELPVNTLKIDRLFVRDITTSPYDAAIARAIIALAESVELRVIAEGVETQEQVDLLEALGCTTMQGYYFSKPLPPEKLPAYFASATPNKRA